MKGPLQQRYISPHYPFYLAAIPLYFVLHGYTRYVGLIPVQGILFYYAICLIVTGLMVFISRLSLRSYHRAALFVGYLLFIYLFFGAIKDSTLYIPVLRRYSVLLPILLVTVVLLWRYLRRSSRAFRNLASYLNLLFAILITYDSMVLAFTGPVTSHHHAESPVKFTGETKPDIYLLVFDEYAGASVLQSQFGYDNSPFTEALQSRGFHISDQSFSNYSSTPFSIASMFEMNYLDGARKGKEITVEDYTACEQVIENSLLLASVKHAGYDFFNYSIFNIGKHRSEFDPGVLPTKLKLITANTMPARLNRDLYGALQTGLSLRIAAVAKYYQNKYRRGNNKLIQLTLAEAAQVHPRPRFVYTHVFMPHWPYLFDSLGMETKYNAFVPTGPDSDKTMYLSYLKYVNTRILDLVDQLRVKSNNEAIIVVMSDHGYRKANQASEKIVNSNLNAVYLPKRDYRKFYDSISNVNQFRIIINQVFQANMPLKKDSIVF